MDPQSLARAPVEKVKKFCCKKCGGVLAQVFSDAQDKYIVVCGTNHCDPLAIETMYARTLRQAQEGLDYMDVRENYPELCPPVDKESIEKSMQALFPKEE